ncbi:MAG: cation diffusion facilitator family transporter [Polyangiaceae bacterium]
MRSPSSASLRTVAIALVANLGTALAKLAAALFTGSSAMWAEAFHAFADTGNEVLLLVAQRRSARAADEQHPLGHGREAYFWALVAALGVFVSGALLSVHQGIEGLLHQHRVLSFRVAYLILTVSACLDGASLLQAQAQLKREARALTRTFLEHLDLSSDPVVRAVFAEDAAALVGNLAAFVGIALHQATGSAIPDGIAAIFIGLLLGFVALQLAARNGNILIGAQASADLRTRIATVIVAQPGILEITELLVTFVGPRQVWVVARVAIDDGLSGANVQQLVCSAEAVLKRGSPFIARVDIVPRGRGSTAVSLQPDSALRGVAGYRV